VKIEVEKTGAEDESIYVLHREDGEQHRTSDLTELRRVYKLWEEMEYQPRTVRQALAMLGEQVTALRPGVNPKPTKEQLSKARLTAKQINKLLKEGKLAP